MYEVIRFIHPLAAIQAFSHTFPVLLGIIIGTPTCVPILFLTTSIFSVSNSGNRIPYCFLHDFHMLFSGFPPVFLTIESSFEI